MRRHQTDQETLVSDLKLWAADSVCLKLNWTFSPRLHRPSPPPPRTWPRVGLQGGAHAGLYCRNFGWSAPLTEQNSPLCLFSPPCPLSRVGTSHCATEGGGGLSYAGRLKQEVEPEPKTEAFTDLISTGNLSSADLTLWFNTFCFWGNQTFNLRVSGKLL